MYMYVYILTHCHVTLHRGPGITSCLYFACAYFSLSVNQLPIQTGMESDVGPFRTELGSEGREFEVCICCHFTGTYL